MNCTLPLRKWYFLIRRAPLYCTCCKYWGLYCYIGVVFDRRAVQLTDTDRQRPTATDNDRQRPTATDSDRQRPTTTDVPHVPTDRRPTTDRPPTDRRPTADRPPTDRRPTPHLIGRRPPNMIASCYSQTAGPADPTTDPTTGAGDIFVTKSAPVDLRTPHIT